MTAITRTTTIVVCVILALSLTAPAVAQEAGESTPTTTDSETPAQNQAIEDGTIRSCGTITEDGRYEISSDFEHDGSEECLIVEANSVTIQGGLMQGDRDTSTAIKAAGDYDGTIRIRDATFRHWGERALDNEGNGQTFDVDNSEFIQNTHVYAGTEGGGLEMTEVEISDTFDTAIAGDRMADVRLHEVSVVGGGASSISTMDGANLRITSSEFRNNDGPIFFGHSTSAEVHNTDIIGNNADGITVTGSAHNVNVEIVDSTIRENDGNGVRGSPLRDPEYSSLTIENTEIDDNSGKAIQSSFDGEWIHNVISASNVDLGGGLVVSFENQAVDIGTEAATDHATDALNVTGQSDAEITAEFTTGGDESQLWAQVNDGWQQRGTYGGGAFTQVIGPGLWAATAGTQSTSTPQRTTTPEETDTPTSTPEPEDGSSNPSQPGDDGLGSQADTPAAAETPATEDTPSQPEVSDSTPNDRITIQSTPDDTVSNTDSETAEPDDTAADGTETSTDTVGNDDTQDEQTENDDGVSMDGPGFGFLPALTAVVAGAILLRKCS